MAADIGAGFLEELFSTLRREEHTRRQLASLKIALAGKYRLQRIPHDYELLLLAPEDDAIRSQLRMKPVRTRSGVAAVALMTEPRACDHGTCVMCPGGPGSAFGDVPQSYTGSEPASMRAARNRYDAYLQVFNRLEQYILLGHEPGKVEMIVMGGTFPSYPLSYQYRFVSDALAAMNDFSAEFYRKGRLDREKFRSSLRLQRDPGNTAAKEKVQQVVLSLKRSAEKNDLARAEKEQSRNEKARIRCVALCIETRPDFSMEKHIGRMLSLGTTRVELGVQSLSDAVLWRIRRGHIVQDSVKATALLKDSFLKVGYHMMPGLPGSSEESDIEMFRELFSNPAYRPDALKIYPCLVMPGTPLEAAYRKGKFRPLSTEQAARIVAEAKRFIPEYCRVMRVQRDIPHTKILAGPRYTNLRQKVHEMLGWEKRKCGCLRCREPGAMQIDISSVKMKQQTYEASGGIEVFLSLEEPKKDVVLGYCRLRLPAEPFRPEITASTAGIRELHVFGAAAEFGREGEVQHRGFGSRLLAEAERIAREELDARRLLVISGIGVRDYFRKRGYRRKGPYLGKTLQQSPLSRQARIGH